MAQVEFRVPGPGTYIIEASPSLPPLSQPGTAADVLTGEQFYGEDGNPVTGTMPDNPAEAVIIQGGGSYTIPKGYHTGKGTVTSEGTELPTLANPANAGEIISGKQSIGQNGETLTGTMPNNGAVSKDLTAGEKYIIPAGYHNGQGKVTAPTVASETPGTAEAVDILSGKTAWVNGEQITGSIPTKTAEDVTIQGASVSVPSGYYGPNIAKAIPTVEQTVPTISVSPEGLITAQAQQTEGFVAGGTKSATNQLPVQGAQTITPSTTAQTIQPNVYLTGAQTVQGDANLVPDNIKEAVSIFGVTGTYAGSGGDFAVPLTVTVDSGATVTAINGDISLTEISDGTANFNLTRGGSWSITATLGEKVGNTIVQIPFSFSSKIVFQGIVSYFGLAEALSQKRYLFASASNNGYALFAGGVAESGQPTGIVDAYGATLTKTTPSSLSAARCGLSGAFVGQYFLFGGGNTGGITQPPSSASDVVDYYDDGLTRGTLTSLSSISYNLSATQISNYAMFGGGYGGGNMLNAYDSKLTRTVGTPLSASRYYLSSGTLDNHAFFGGGFSAIDVVDTYNTELTKTQLSPLSIGRYGIAVASTNSYILFSGGMEGSTQYSTVDVYDTELTRTSADSLSIARGNATGVSCGENALIGGGAGNSVPDLYSKNVDCYDSSLTRTLAQELPSGWQSMISANAGGYALFAGGAHGTGQYNDTVAAYTIE